MEPHVESPALTAAEQDALRRRVKPLITVTRPRIPLANAARFERHEAAHVLENETANGPQDGTGSMGGGGAGGKGDGQKFGSMGKEGVENGVGGGGAMRVEEQLRCIFGKTLKLEENLAEGGGGGGKAGHRHGQEGGVSGMGGTRELEVIVCSGAHMPKMDLIGSCDPYVVLEYRWCMYPVGMRICVYSRRAFYVVLE